MQEDLTTSFVEAILRSDLAHVEAALAQHPELAHAVAPTALAPENISGCTALHLAAYSGCADIERLLVRHGADPGAVNGEGRTPLHTALEYNNTTRQILIDLGVPVDAAAAAALNDVPRLAALLDADPGLVEDRTTRLTPLEWAAYHNALDTALELLRRGGDPNDGALLCAASVAAVAMGELLLTAGAGPNATPAGRGFTALHVAAAMRYTDDGTDFVQLLLSSGADPGAVTEDGRTPLDVARCALERERESHGDAGARWEGLGRVVALLEEQLTGSEK